MSDTNSGQSETIRCLRQNSTNDAHKDRHRNLDKHVNTLHRTWLHGYMLGFLNNACRGGHILTWPHVSDICEKSEVSWIGLGPGQVAIFKRQGR